MTGPVNSPTDVIVVDDRPKEESIIRHLLLDLCGCNAHFYGDYRAGYEAILEQIGDRLLINYQLGGKNLGAALLQKMKREGLEVPTVIINCRPKDRVAVEGFCGNYDFVLHTIESNQISTQAGLIRRAFSKLSLQTRIAPPGRPKVFIIHGRDITALANRTQTSLARLANILNVNFELDTIVLKGNPIDGETIIHQLEKCFKQSAIVVALFTADDVGSLKGQREMAPRVRQNVLFETGFARGYLGAPHTIILQESDEIELPSDLGGLRTLRLSSTDQELMIALKQIFENLGIDAPLRVI